MPSKIVKGVIHNLKYDTFCRLRPDAYGGVGVFAIKDIPININPFKYGTGVCPIKTVNIPDRIVKTLDPEVQKMITDFYVLENDGMWCIPKLSLNGNDISFYINTSKTPNVRIINVKKCDMMIFKTMRPIIKGEELFINYDEYK